MKQQIKKQHYRISFADEIAIIIKNVVPYHLESYYAKSYAVILNEFDSHKTLTPEAMKKLRRIKYHFDMLVRASRSPKIDKERIAMENEIKLNLLYNPISQIY